MKKKSLVKASLATAAIAGVFLASTLSVPAFAESAPEPAKGECHGVNACKGQGECGGQGHSCSGKNECKGKGWVSMTEKECKDKGGTFTKK